MNIIKSLHSGVLYRSFQFQGKQFLGLSAIWGFRLDSGEPVLEKDIWSTLAECLPSDQMLDSGMPKARAEYLVLGSFHAPNGQPMEAGEVRVRMGSLEKRLIVHGDRFWKPFLNTERGVAGPKPMTSMPIGWPQAFGGADYPANPKGKGSQTVMVDGAQVHPLPNVEYPGELVTSLNSRPRPASFMPRDIMDPERQKLAGTYDEHYLKTRMPGFPDDLDWCFFNDAPVDQWREPDRFWRGDEDFEIHYMHPDKPHLRGRLPGVRARCFLRFRDPGNAQVREVKTHIDTLWLVPDRNLGLIIHRGSLAIGTDDGTDVSDFLIGHENLSDPERPVAHYENELALRTHPEDRFKYQLYTAPLIPDGTRCGFKQLVEETSFPLEMLVQQNGERFGEKQRDNAQGKIDDQIAQTKQQLAAAGVDADAVLAKLEAAKSAPNADAEAIKALVNKISPGLADGKPVELSQLNLKALDELDAFMKGMADRKRQDVKLSLQQEVDRLRARELDDQSQGAVVKLEQMLVDFDRPPMLPRPLNAETLRQTAEQLSDFNRQLDTLRQEGVDPRQIAELEQQLQGAQVQLKQAKEQVREGYRRSAHLLDECRSPHEGQEAVLRREIEQKLRSGQGLAGGDYAFVDFKGLSLRGVDLSNCYLEYADFTGVDLRGANLTGAILCRAKLHRARLDGALLNRANLGSAFVDGTCLDAALVDDVILARARIQDSSFRGCRFPQAPDLFFEIELVRVDFSDTELVKQIFIARELVGCRFDRANLSDSFFVQPKLRDVSFQGANLTSVNFVEAQAEGTDFTGANMHNVRFVGSGQWSRGIFVDAVISAANLRGCTLREANFTGALMTQTDLSGSDLSGATFERVSAQQAQFGDATLDGANCRRADLLGASFMAASLKGVDFRDSNLYSANFLRSTLGNTNFRGAYLEQTILKDWRP